MTLFDEIAWLVREDKMDCHGQAWEVEKCGACPADAKDLEQHFCAGKGAQSAGPHPIGLARACAGLRAHATSSANQFSTRGVEMFITTLNPQPSTPYRHILILTLTHCKCRIVEESKCGRIGGGRARVGACLLAYLV